MKFKTFFLQRILAWALTILIGVTFIFFIPRMFPSDPVENMIAQMQSRSGNMDPAEMEALRQQLRIQFGLDGTLLEQYGYFLLHGLLQFDFGPSLMSYPEPVTSIIGRNLPYTLGLSLTTTLLAWIIGNFIGLLAGFRKNKTSSKILEGIAICIYPIPYFLVALVLQIVFAFVLGWFPIQTTLLTRGTFAQWLGSLLKASVLPGISMLLLSTGWTLYIRSSTREFVTVDKEGSCNEKICKILESSQLPPEVRSYRDPDILYHRFRCLLCTAREPVHVQYLPE